MGGEGWGTRSAVEYFLASTLNVCVREFGYQSPGGNTTCQQSAILDGLAVIVAHG